MKNWCRFSLKTLFVLVLLCAVLFAWYRDRQRLSEDLQLANVQIEVYTDPAKFEARLGGDVQVVDFDDVSTATADHVAFAKDRYAAKGILIQGVGGQFVGKRFGPVGEFPPVSRPNMYAPGPRAKPSAGARAGGNKTTVSFSAGGRSGLSSAFGVTFIDADFPSLGPCSMSAVGPTGRELRAYKKISSPNRGKIFVGFVAVDSEGNPVPAISCIRIINGSGWPEITAGEGVALDDFMFAVPIRNRFAK